MNNLLKKQDEIRIENLEIYAYHGVFPEENEKGQHFYVNAVLYTDTRKAELSDDLTLSVNYAEVAQFMYDYLQVHTFKLIETAAGRLAEEVLLAFPLVHRLDLEIRKPEAPMGLNFSSVSVKISRGWRQTYVAVGANLGEREANIRQAVGQLKDCPQIRNVRVSELFYSTPYGGVEQPDFVNGALAFETLLRPEELLIFLQELERRAEREKTRRWGPRTLDLDILFYEEVVMDREDLVIPHPDMHNRDFVLAPLAQLAPYLWHPRYQKTVGQLLAELPEKHIICRDGCGKED